MNWYGIGKFFSDWGRSFKKNGIHSENRFQGFGRTNYPRNHKSKKSLKNKNKNRTGRKARKQNRK